MSVQDAKTCRQRSTFSRIGDRLVVISELWKIWGVFVFKFGVLGVFVFKTPYFLVNYAFFLPAIGCYLALSLTEHAV